MWYHGWKNKIKFSFLSSSGYPHSHRKGNPVTGPHIFFQVLGWGSSSGNIPPKGPVRQPNKKCHFACPAPGFLRANTATNTSCCHVTSNCHPSHPRNANHCKPKWWPVISLIYWGANDVNICILVCCHLCHSFLKRKKPHRSLVYSPPYSPPFILQLGRIWGLSEALWLLTEPSKLQRE